MLRALIHTSFSWVLSPIVPQVLSVFLVSLLCPFCCGCSSWRGTQKNMYSILAISFFSNESKSTIYFYRSFKLFLLHFILDDH